VSSEAAEAAFQLIVTVGGASSTGVLIAGLVTKLKRRAEEGREANQILIDSSQHLMDEYRKQIRSLQDDIETMMKAGGKTVQRPPASNPSPKKIAPKIQDPEPSTPIAALIDKDWLTEADHEFFRFWDSMIAIPSDSFEAVWGEDLKQPEEPQPEPLVAKPGETWMETRERCQAEHDARRHGPPTKRTHGSFLLALEQAPTQRDANDARRDWYGSPEYRVWFNQRLDKAYGDELALSELLSETIDAHDELKKVIGIPGEIVDRLNRYTWSISGHLERLHAKEKEEKKTTSTEEADDRQYMQTFTGQELAIIANAKIPPAMLPSISIGDEVGRAMEAACELIKKHNLPMPPDLAAIIQARIQSETPEKE
jgi:hypothetical protein